MCDLKKNYSTIIFLTPFYQNTVCTINVVSRYTHKNTLPLSTKLFERP